MSERSGSIGGRDDPIAVQFALPSRQGVPAAASLRRWVRAALEPGRDGCELCLRIVDQSAMQRLNHAYRGHDRSTNVLSFPGPSGLHHPAGHLGDVVICAAVAQREARRHGKAPRERWAHLVVHGVLHLQGHDHIKAEEAAIMESREREILAGLGIGDPYAVAVEDGDGVPGSGEVNAATVTADCAD